MPTVAVDKEDLYQALGRSYTTEEFDELCFEFGIELDEDTSQGELQPGERPQLKIEIPANRYDMLCFEGIARALNIFLGREELPQFKQTDVKEADMYEFVVDPSVEKVRPYASGAVLRGLKFTPRRYESFIGLQEKLHQNLCRQRSLVAIGTHDLSKVTGRKIRYTGRKPDDIKFKPLNQSQEMTGSQLMEFYDKDRNIGRYLHLIRDSPVYPVFLDESDSVLSLPPIINSDLTKITLDTRDVLIDLSGTDKTKIDLVGQQIVAMFAEYASEPFTVEPIRIVSEHNGMTRVTPNMAPRTTTAEIAYINSCLGLKYDAAEISKLLKRMSLDAAPSKTDDALIDVHVPVTRSDILHQCDIMEDVGIAYGFNNLERTIPSNSYTIGNAQAVNRLADIFRREAAMATWTETMPLTLCSHDENFAWLRQKDDGKTAVSLANPKTLEYQVVRTTLLPGLLKTIRENRKHTLPIKVFETGDIVVKALDTERRAVNHRRFGAVYAGKTSGFEVVHGLLDRMMKMLRVPWSSGETAERGYWIREVDNPTFFPGRGAEVVYREDKGADAKVIGQLGALHPEVLAFYELPFVASSLELDVEAFLLPESTN